MSTPDVILVHTLYIYKYENITQNTQHMAFCKSNIVILDLGGNLGEYPHLSYTHYKYRRNYGE